LLRNLRNAELDLSLETYLLLWASTAKLAATIAWFRPSVVHFIAHGGYAEGKGFLRLVHDERPTEMVNVYAPTLLENLRAGGARPEIVVLNACYSAGAELEEVGQVASPLAVELVAAGVPVVVGMAGAVADRACRLFTRRFYQSLLEGGQI